MSGPKRSDVQAALDTAARAAQATSTLLAKAERDSVNLMQRRLRSVLSEGESLRHTLREVAGELGTGQHGGDDTVSAQKAVAAALAALDGAVGTEDASSASGRKAEEAERQAQHAYEQAQVEYDKAERGLRQAGSHYLTNQMAWAKNAKRMFLEAGESAQRAAKLRAESKAAARSAVKTAEVAVAQAKRALTAGQRAAHTAQARARAAAEAARIAQENRRIATAALVHARIAVDALDASTVDKFIPGARRGLTERVGAGAQALEAGRFDDVQRCLAGVSNDATQVAIDATAAKRRWDEQRAAALAAQSEFNSLLDSADSDLVGAWADDHNAMGAARQAAASIAVAIDQERFAEAESTAAAAGDRLGTANASAAAAKGRDLRRAEIGEAVMDVLEELGFDVSFEEGSRDAPLRISGQTATIDGRGDFDIEIPLDGEVGFEVRATEGDVSCVNAVEALQGKLAERGVTWNVTDWGHATDAVGGAGRSMTREKTQARTMSKGH